MKQSNSGLLDVTGKEIREGDFLEWSIDIADSPNLVDYVKVSDGMFITATDKDILAEVVDGAKIIGNVYDNPQLKNLIDRTPIEKEEILLEDDRPY